LRIERLKGALFLALIIASLMAPLPLISAGKAWGQDVGWVRQFGTSGSDGAQGVAVDSSGNVYVAGGTNGALPGQTNSGIDDAFVRKYDSSGSELWTKQFGASAYDSALDAAVDGPGNVYVAGYAYGALPGQTSSDYYYDAFVRKYDSSGSELWTRQFGTSGGDVAQGVAVDSSGNIYVAGDTDNALPGQNTNINAFVRKYNGSGNEVWTRQFGTAEAYDSALGVVVDGSGNVYAAGTVWGALPGQTYLGSGDAFVRKYDGSGNEIWTRQFGSSDSDEARAVAVDASGNVYVAGWMSGAAFVRKYDGSGNELWTRQFGTSYYPGASGVAVDSSGNVYVAGDTDNALPGQSTNINAFLRKYDSSGSELWTRQFGTSGSDRASDVAVDSSGNVYVAGYTDNALPGQTSSGDVDAFVVKFALIGVDVSISPSYNSGSPGATLDYTVTVTNTGLLADNYSLTASDNAGWNPTLSTYQFTNVPPGESTTTLRVTVPSGAENGTTDNVKVTATSRADNAISDSDSCLVQAVVHAVVPGVGVKTGDWVKLDYTISGAPPGTNLPRWIKLEFLSVEGTIANVRVTMHMADGTEQSDNVPVDVAAGGGAFAGLSGFVIPANTEVGDSINMSGYGTVTIAGEKTKTYAGASRTVVYVSISQFGAQLTYYWDKQTGVMVEASGTSDGMTATAKVKETNIWQAGPPEEAPTNWSLIAGIVGAVVIIGVGLTIYLKRR